MLGNLFVWEAMNTAGKCAYDFARRSIPACRVVVSDETDYETEAVSLAINFIDVESGRVLALIDLENKEVRSGIEDALAKHMADGKFALKIKQNKKKYRYAQQFSPEPMTWEDACNCYQD